MKTAVAFAFLLFILAFPLSAQAGIDDASGNDVHFQGSVDCSTDSTSQACAVQKAVETFAAASNAAVNAAYANLSASCGGGQAEAIDPDVNNPPDGGGGAGSFRCFTSIACEPPGPSGQYTNCICINCCVYQFLYPHGFPTMVCSGTYSCRP